MREASSPFPGMDPYLERSDLWQGFHNRFMTHFCDALQPQHLEGFVATLEVRIYLDHEAEGGLPEQGVPDQEVHRSATPMGGVRPLERAEQELEGFWVSDPRVERREAFIALRSLEDEELLTTVELLSPSNKRSSDGRREYREKQEELIRAGVSFVELDLLRGGAHTIAAPGQRVRELFAHDYRYCIFRAWRNTGYQVIPFTLRDRAPLAPITLTRDLPEPRVDVQAVLDETYERGRFGWLLRHRRAVEPPLTSDDADWAEGLLRAAGRRDADA